MSCPVTYVERSDARKTATSAISFVSASLCKEIFFISSFIKSSRVFSLLISVFVRPGQMALTLILKVPNSLAKTLEVDEIAAFVLE